MTLMSLFRHEDAVSTTTLRHNPLNAVTATVERLTDATGRTVIYKELRQPTGVDAWAASADPRHWNYWRRELEVYQDASLRQQLQDTGLGPAGSRGCGAAARRREHLSRGHRWAPWY
jgi:hypothetical protein